MTYQEFEAICTAHEVSLSVDTYDCIMTKLGWVGEELSSKMLSKEIDELVMLYSNLGGNIVKNAEISSRALTRIWGE